MYLVTGATGHVGGPVARQLHEQGHSVRALVRDPSRAASLPAGIELAVMDPEDIARVAVAVLTEDGHDVENITAMAPATALGANATPTPSAEARLTTYLLAQRSF